MYVGMGMRMGFTGRGKWERQNTEWQNMEWWQTNLTVLISSRDFRTNAWNVTVWHGNLGVNERFQFCKTELRRNIIFCMWLRGASSVKCVLASNHYPNYLELVSWFPEESTFLSGSAETRTAGQPSCQDQLERWWQHSALHMGQGLNSEVWTTTILMGSAWSPQIGIPEWADPIHDLLDTPTDLILPRLLDWAEAGLNVQLWSLTARPYLNRFCFIGSYRCILD
jgi:hypothetical protein